MYMKHSLLLRLSQEKVFNMESSLFMSKTTRTTTVIVHVQSIEMAQFKPAGLLKE